jgi:hypothetical protein
MDNCPHCGLPLNEQPYDPNLNMPRDNTPATYGLKDTFNFGKYRGRTLESVLNEDPQYIAWANQNVDFFVVSNEILSKANLLKTYQNAPRHSYYYDEDFEDYFSWEDYGNN